MEPTTVEINPEFSGSKLALIFGSKVLVYKRDDNDHIPFPGFWDLPGGGREGGESPEECVLRELEEEFSISISAARPCYKRRVSSVDGRSSAFFFVANGRPSEIEAIAFGNEGQFWRLMDVNEFLDHPEAVPSLVDRLRSYLDAVNS